MFGEMHVRVALMTEVEADLANHLVLKAVLSLARPTGRSADGTSGGTRVAMAQHLHCDTFRALTAEGQASGATA